MVSNVGICLTIYSNVIGISERGVPTLWLNRSQYPNRSWKIYRNTSSFIPKPGDIAVWTYGWAGHTAIVVGPSDKKDLSLCGSKLVPFKPMEWFESSVC